MALEVRRIVTGHDSQGKAAVATDERLADTGAVFESLFVDCLGSDRLRFRQELERRQYRLRPRLEIERRLLFLFGAPSLSERPPFGRNISLAGCVLALVVMIILDRRPVSVRFWP
jgi:hypothetical protein